MNTKRLGKGVVSLFCLLAFPLATSPAVAGAPVPALPALATLTPGGSTALAADLPVTIVFIGVDVTESYPPSSPQSVSLPVVDYFMPPTVVPALEGSPRTRPRPSSMTLNIRPRYVLADGVFADRFFAFLASQARPTPDLSWGQQQYNSSQTRSFDIPGGSNHLIDAVAVERWLGSHLAELGVDAANPTVVVISWWGRPDFLVHGYTHAESDPDTGVRVGEAYSFAFQTNAWGGTASDDPEHGDGTVRRVWFVDASAGPDYRTANGVLDYPDLDGDGLRDRRLGPIWEYGLAPLYNESVDQLSFDLALATRLVAVNQLFAPSALYNPASSPPAVPSRYEVQITRFDRYPRGSAMTTPSVAPTWTGDTLSRLRPLQPIGVDVDDFARVGAPLEAMLACQAGRTFAEATQPGSACNPSSGDGLMLHDWFWFMDENARKFVDPIRRARAIPVASIADNRISIVGGIAYSSMVDASLPAYVWSFANPDAVAQGFGASRTIAHESGHWLGAKHPHDGVDIPLFGGGYGPGADAYVAWLGTHSSSVMSYGRVEYHFGQFDYDSMDRWTAWAWLEQANAVLAKAYAAPSEKLRDRKRYEAVSVLLLAADAAARDAVAAFAARDYRSGARRAQRAYDRVMDVATALSIKVEPELSPPYTSPSHAPGALEAANEFGALEGMSVPRASGSFRVPAALRTY